MLSNRYLLMGIAGELALAVLFVYPPLQALLGTAALPVRDLLFLLPYPFVVWGADELRRWVLRRRDAWRAGSARVISRLPFVMASHARAAAPTIAPRTRGPGSHAGVLAGILEHRARIMAAIAVVAIAICGLLHLGGNGAVGDDVWRAAAAAELLLEVARTVLVDHHMGVDTIALVAMVGSLALGQELAGRSSV